MFKIGVDDRLDHDIARMEIHVAKSDWLLFCELIDVDVDVVRGAVTVIVRSAAVAKDITKYPVSCGAVVDALTINRRGAQLRHDTVHMLERNGDRRPGATVVRFRIVALNMCFLYRAIGI